MCVRGGKVAAWRERASWKKDASAVEEEVGWERRHGGGDDGR